MEAEDLPLLRLPAELPDCPAHVYPNYLAKAIVQEGGARMLTAMRWGVWAFCANAKPQWLTNARGDGLPTNAVWTKSAATRRCLITASAYFEPGLPGSGQRHTPKPFASRDARPIAH